VQRSLRSGIAGTSDRVAATIDLGRSRLATALVGNHRQGFKELTIAEIGAEDAQVLVTSEARLFSAGRIAERSGVLGL
jgi:hypothetical protein